MTTSKLTQHFYQCCVNHSPQGLASKGWVVALSGGLDSIVLLHLAVKYLPAGSVRAIHVNHHLQEKSDQWAQFCLDQCALLSITCTVCDVYPASNSELAARDARLEAIQSCVGASDCVLMAHHANDQLETVLFRLMRGTGAKGLAGIPVSRRFGVATLLRPLLTITRTELETYAAEQTFSWIDDPSNAADDYDRNYIRHHVIPPMVERWPKAVTRLQQTTQYLADQQQVLESYLDADLQSMALAGGGLNIELLGGVAHPKSIALLRRWFECQTGQPLSALAVQEVFERCIAARADAQPQINVGGIVLRRYRQGVYCVPHKVNDVEDVRSQALMVPFTDWRGGRICVTASSEGFDLQPGVEVVARADGMSIKPKNRPTKTLKKLFQEAGVPPWLRSNWPICVRQNEVVAVPGICVAESCWIKSEEKTAFTLTWRAF